MYDVKNILIRLPNWLGDMVMATSFVKAVQNEYPQATIDFIVKKGLDSLLDFFPTHQHRFIFCKEKFKGLRGAHVFGLTVKAHKKYDVFFCLPDSLSATVMANAIHAKKSIGFKKSVHHIFFTKGYVRKKNVHRVEEFIDLLSQFAKKNIITPSVQLTPTHFQKNNAIVININSEAPSRRLPILKAVAIINQIQKNCSLQILLIGSAKEVPYVNTVFEQLTNKKTVLNLAGKTNITQLVNIFAGCKAMLSTDSGPAHLCNALGTKTMVLFGAGNQKNTAPYNSASLNILRLNKLPCEPCLKNECKIYPEPECLLQLSNSLIANQLLSMIT